MAKTNKGLGDTIDSITTKTGIKGAIKKSLVIHVGVKNAEKNSMHSIQILKTLDHSQMMKKRCLSQ